MSEAMHVSTNHTCQHITRFSSFQQTMTSTLNDGEFNWENLPSATRTGSVSTNLMDYGENNESYGVQKSTRFSCCWFELISFDVVVKTLNRYRFQVPASLLQTELCKIRISTSEWKPFVRTGDQTMHKASKLLRIELLESFKSSGGLRTQMALTNVRKQTLRSP